MTDKAFSDKLQKRLNESAGYAQYGRQDTPVQSAQWPDSGDQSQPPASNVTDGETLPLGAPRADMAAQENGGIDGEVVGEIASLLLSIGFILQQAGMVEDKFNVTAVIGYLGSNFGGGTDPSVQPGQDQGAEVAVVGGGENPIATPSAPLQNDQVNERMSKPKMANMVSTYMEQRKLLESKFKK